MNRPTPSLSAYKNTPMVSTLIAVYHAASTARPQPGTSTTCALRRTYGMRKYLGSNSGVGRRVGRTNIGSIRVWRMV